MKKILGSLVVATLLWATSTAIIGSQMQSSLEQQVEKTNQAYSNKGIQYKILNYKKNFLDSTLKLEIIFNDPLILSITKDILKPLIIDYKIQHGPLFFSNGIEFGLAKVNKEIIVSQLLKEETKHKFLATLKDDIKISTNMIVSLTNNLNFKMRTTTINIDKDGGILTVPPLKFSGISNLKNYEGNLELSLPSLKFSEEKTHTNLQLQNLHLNVKIDELIEKSIMLGEIDFSLEDINMTAPNLPKKEFHASMDMHILTKRETNHALSTFAKGYIDLKDTELPKGVPEVERANLEISMQHLGITGMLKFQKASEEMQKKQSQLIAKLQGSQAEDMQQIFQELAMLQENMTTEILQALNTLLIKNKTTIHYAIDVQNKDRNTSTASIDVGYTGDIKFIGNREKIQKEIQEKMLDLLKLQVHLSINPEHLQALPNAIVIQQQLDMGILQGIIKEKKGNYDLSASYKNRELIINDNNMTATVLPLLIMGMQMNAGLN